MTCVVSGTCPLHIRKNTEQDKSLTCVTRSGSPSQPRSDQSDDSQSDVCSCSSAIEVHTCICDSNDTGFGSKTAQVDGVASKYHLHQQEGSGSDDMIWPGSRSSSRSSRSSTTSTMLTEEETQKRLEKMSQVVMEAWSKLQALESKLIISGDALASPYSPNKPSNETVGAAATQTAHTANRSVPQHSRLAASRCDSYATTKASQTYTGASSRRSKDAESLFGTGVGTVGRAQAVLTSAKHVLDSTPGVVGTAIELAIAGTMATLFVEMPPDSEETARLSVKAIAKAALLEAAESTQIVYILGYEAGPFKDNSCGTGFAGTLAITPHSRQSCACWETLTQGLCPRGSKCKWWHPGRDEIVPIQVVLRS